MCHRYKPLSNPHVCEFCVPSTETNSSPDASQRLAEQIRSSIAAQSELLAKLDDICKSIGDLTVKTAQARSFSAEGSERSLRVDQTIDSSVGTGNKRVSFSKCQIGSAKVRTTFDRVSLGNGTGEVRSERVPRRAARLQTPQTSNQTNVSQKPEESAESRFRPFRARPLPERIFRTEYRLTRQAQEEVRKVCVKARAEEMLKCSGSPFSERKLKFTRIHSNQRLQGEDDRTKNEQDAKKSPESDCKDGTTERARSGSLPRRRTSKRRQLSATVGRRSASCRPAEEHCQKRFFRPVPKVPPADVKLNATAQLRQYHARQRRSREERLRWESDGDWLTRRRHETELRGRIVRFTSERCPPDHGRGLKERLLSHRTTSLQRNEEYRRELSEMNDRVWREPLLMEKQAVHCARQQLENKYRRKLREVGVDPEFLERKAAKSKPARSSSAHSQGSFRRSPSRSLNSASESEDDAQHVLDPEKSGSSGSSGRTFTADS